MNLSFSSHAVKGHSSYLILLGGGGGSIAVNVYSDLARRKRSSTSFQFGRLSFEICGGQRIVNVDLLSDFLRCNVEGGSRSIVVREEVSGGR